MRNAEWEAGIADFRLRIADCGLAAGECGAATRFWPTGLTAYFDGDFLRHCHLDCRLLLFGLGGIFSIAANKTREILALFADQS
jgi:hypothetical protein